MIEIGGVIPKVTVSMPCFGRPERTKRAIQSIVDQTLTGWEARIGGDGCPHFQQLIDSGWLEDVTVRAKRNGNTIIYENHPHKGGCGYNITNYNIQNAQGKYIVFMANDDIITPKHLFQYYYSIKDTGLDYMYFNTWLDPTQEIRVSNLAPSQIGHSEIIVNTALAKKAPPHSPVYGHDWDFINYIAQHGKGAKANSTETTYHVMHIPNFGTKDVID